MKVGLDERNNMKSKIFCDYAKKMNYCSTFDKLTNFWANSLHR